MYERNALDWTALVLVIVGAINWGLWGLFNLDLVAVLLGWSPIIAKLVYIIIGLAGIYLIYYVSKRPQPL